jgi:C-terminal processing protease CtpA/Prc
VLVNAIPAVKAAEDFDSFNQEIANLIDTAGDIIVKCNNTDIDVFREDLKKYIPGSNEPVIQRNINAYVRRGTAEQLTFTILRDGVLSDVTVKGYNLTTIRNETKFQDNLLPKWKILPGNIGYIHMGILQIPDVSAAMADLTNTEAIIFDVRNYPRYTWRFITPYLLPRLAHFARFSLPDLDFPGSFYDSVLIPASMEDNPGYYRGKVVILCNEVTQSHAEYTCMALQTAPGATVIGSQTAGADGDVRYIYLPGGIVTYMTGYGVFYPDGTPTQRVGIVPDIEIRSTVKGIKQGRDEVLERAVQFIESN